MQGGTARHKSDGVEIDLIQIPRDFYELHKFLTLTVDVMFVNGIAFLTTLSRKVIFLTIKHIPSHTAAHISSSLTKIVNIYKRGGFRVIFIDIYFEKVLYYL